MKSKEYFKSAIILTFIILSLSACRQGSRNKKEEAGLPAKSEQKGGPDAEEFMVNKKNKNGNIDMSQFPVTIFNVPYVADRIQYHLLDIIYPFYGKPPYKTIVVFHGGGWMAGDKQSESISPVFQATAQGYAVVSVNYRLSDEVKWPKPLHDAKAAIRFLRANSARYRLDTKKIVVWGFSAGGHIAEMLAATNDMPESEDPSLGNPDFSSTVQGVVSWYGVSDIRTVTGSALTAANKLMGYNVIKEMERAAEASPFELVKKDFPPLLLVHGTDDQAVPYSQAVEMQKRVNEINGKMTASLLSIKGATHGDPMIKTAENVGASLNFVDSILYDGINPYRNTNYMTVRIINLTSGN